MRMYGEMAGISVQVHPHMLRHSCGYALADKDRYAFDSRLFRTQNIQNTVIYTATNVERFRAISI